MFHGKLKEICDVKNKENLDQLLYIGLKTILSSCKKNEAWKQNWKILFALMNLKKSGLKSRVT